MPLSSLDTAGVDTPQTLSDSYGVRLPAKDFLKGALWVEDENFGWVRPERFYPEQKRALVSCAAWYPGVFRQMAECTSGVSLEFLTDSTSLELEIRYDAEPRVTQNVLEQSALELAFGDSILVAVDANSSYKQVALNKEATSFILKIEIEDEAPAAELSESAETGESPKGAVQQESEEQLGGKPKASVGSKKTKPSRKAQQLQLPGFGDEHHVKIYLLAFRGCALRNIQGDGTYFLPAELRPQMLVLGDSIAQGYTADSAASAWPSLVAGALNFELVNQSVAAQVFQPSMLLGLEAYKDTLNPELVLVALGTNYRFGACSASLARQDIKRFLRSVDELYPKARLVVLLPHVGGSPVVERSCFSEVPELIKQEASALKALRMKNGRQPVLVAQLPELPLEFLADSVVHPSTQGHAYLAKVILKELKAFECDCFVTLGEFGRCGACERTEL